MTAGNPLKGIHGRDARRRMGRAAAANARRARSDEQRRDRMRELDDNTPLKPRRVDLVTGKAAQDELARIEKALESEGLGEVADALRVCAGKVQIVVDTS